MVSTHFTFLSKVSDINAILSITGNLACENDTKIINWRFYKIRGFNYIYKLLSSKFTKDIVLQIAKHYLSDDVHFIKINMIGNRVNCLKTFFSKWLAKISAFSRGVCAIFPFLSFILTTFAGL